MSVDITQQEISFRNSSIDYIKYIRQYTKNRIWSGFFNVHDLPIYNVQKVSSGWVG